MLKNKILSACFGFFLVVTGILIPTNVAFADSNIITKSIPITRLAGEDRYQTAAKISQEGWAANSSNIAVLAAGMNDNLVDALTAAPLAKLKNAPILLTQGNQLNTYTKQELQRLGVKSVYVTSGLGVISQPVIDELKAMNITVISLGGSDRFATAINIAKEVGFKGRLVVASGYSNADALSIAAIAAQQSMPIILTRKDKIPDNVAGYIDQIKSEITYTYLVGGTGVVAATVEEQLPNAIRIGGTDRYDTNKLVLGNFSLTFAAEEDVVYVANGENDHLVDSLTGAILAAKASSAIVLTSNPMQDNTRNYLQDMFPLAELVVFGGDTLVPQAELEQICSYVEYTASETLISGESSDDPLVLTDNIKVSGDSVHVENTGFVHNLYITGTNTRLGNIYVEGAVIIEPSVAGTIVMDNVMAKSIIINRGAVGSIEMRDVQADIFLNQNKVPMNITLEGNTEFLYSVMMADSKFDAGTEGSTFGNIMILSVPKADGTIPKLNVELAGVYDNPILLSGHAAITAMPESSVANIQIVTNKTNNITLKGEFNQVDVLTEALMEVIGGSAIENIAIYANTDITVNQDVTINAITKKNNASLSLNGDGASKVTNILTE